MDYKKFTDTLQDFYNNWQTPSVHPKSTALKELASKYPDFALPNANAALLINLAAKYLEDDECYCEIDCFGRTIIPSLYNNPRVNAYCVSPFTRVYKDLQKYQSFLSSLLEEMQSDSGILISDCTDEQFFLDVQELDEFDKIGFCVFGPNSNNYRKNLIRFEQLKPFLSDRAVIISIVNSQSIALANQDFLAKNQEFNLLWDWDLLSSVETSYFPRTQVITFDRHRVSPVSQKGDRQYDNVSSTSQEDTALAYIDLLKRALTNSFYRDVSSVNTGGNWNTNAHTMLGMGRLNNIQFCLQDVIARDIPGDVIETGVWRGGATILMRGILKAYGVTDRKVWVADSFEGLPPTTYKNDSKLQLESISELAISLEEVRGNFQKYGLLDSQVVFLKGWFKDTLPHAPIEKLAILRLDGDLYESTMDALINLYPKLSIGGFIIIDDYYEKELLGCRDAVHDYRTKHGIQEPIIDIDDIDDASKQVIKTAVYWQRQQ